MRTSREPLEFEQAFWARRGLAPGREQSGLGFHPLDLGQQAMRFLFGFALEGRPEPDDVDAGQIAMLGVSGHRSGWRRASGAGGRSPGVPANTQAPEVPAPVRWIGGRDRRRV